MKHRNNNGQQPFGAKAFEWRDGRWVLRRKKSWYRCSVLWCNRPRAAHLTVCKTCASREWRANNQIAYAFNNLKRHAKMRRIPFTLTIEQFTVFCLESGYHNRRGQTPRALNVDRIDCERGYTIDNIQALTASENGLKSIQERKQKQMDIPF